MKPWCSTVVLSDKNVLFFLRRPVTGVRWSPAPCCCGPASCTCSGGPGSCTCYSSSPPPPRPDRPQSSSPQGWPPNGSLVLQMGLWSSKRLIGPPNGSLVLQMGRCSSKWVIGPPNGQPYYWSSKRIIPCSLHGASYTTSYQPPCSLLTSFQQPSIHSAALIFSFMNQTYLGPW